MLSPTKLERHLHTSSLDLVVLKSFLGLSDPVWREQNNNNDAIMEQVQEGATVEYFEECAHTQRSYYARHVSTDYKAGRPEAVSVVE